MEFFDFENIKDIRLRSFFVTSNEEGEIRSEGSFSIEILNVGDTSILLEDVGGGKWTLQPSFPFEFNSFKLVGHPGLVRDDIIKYTFGDEGEAPAIQIRYDRYIKKGDDAKYPGQPA